MKFQMKSIISCTVVPQGGNTSMVGGATPSADGSEFVLSLARMARIRDIDPLDLTMTVEAGVTLKAAHAYAGGSQTVAQGTSAQPSNTGGLSELPEV